MQWSQHVGHSETLYAKDGELTRRFNGSHTITLIH